MDNEITPLDEQKLTKGFADALAMFDRYEKRLRSMEDGPGKTALALEYSQECKRFLDAVARSELREHVTQLDQEHKRALKWLNGVIRPIEGHRRYFDSIRIDAEMRRRQEIEADRQKREQQANLFQQKQRQAEIEHLRQIGKEQEAEAKAKAPVIPITVNVDREAGKPAGEVMVEVWRPKRGDDGNIVFDDLVSYLAWLAGNPPMYHLIKHEYGKLKKLLTDHRGMLQPPGLEIEHTFEPRTRGSDE